MVGLFVRLKLRLLANRLRTSDWQAVIGFVLLSLLALGAGAGVMSGMTLIGRFAGEWRAEALLIVFVTVTAAWLVGPVVAAAIDDTLDVRAFEALPLSNRQLGAGLLAAGMVGPGGAATLLALVGGAVAAYGDSVPMLVSAIGGGLVASALAVAAGRWSTTWLSDLLRSRRTREVVAIVFALAVSIPALASGLLGSGQVELEALLESLVGLRWIPPGSIAWSIVSASEGRWVEALLFLSVGIVTLVMALWSYGVAIRRLQTRPVGGTAAGRRRARRGLRPVLAGPRGAVISKELRYAVRDARLRSQFLGSGIAIVALVVVGGTGDVFASRYAPLAGVVVAVLLLLPIVTNQFGADAGGFWTYVVAAPDLSSVLRGKNLGWGLVAVPIGSLVALTAAVISRHAEYLGVALLAVLVVTFLFMAVGNAVSILGAFPLREQNLFGNSNVGGAVALWSIGGLLVLGVVQLPAALAIGVTAVIAGPGWTTAAGALALVYAVGVYLVGWKWVAVLAKSRTHELLSTIDA